MTIAKAKEEYNLLLKRFEKANEYFERKDIASNEKETFIEAYQEILRGLNYYLELIGVYSEKEVLEGF